MLALLLASGRHYSAAALVAGGIVVFGTALRLSPFGLPGAWVSLLGLVLGALVLGAVMLVRVGQGRLTPNERFGGHAGHMRTSRRFQSSVAIAAVVPLGVAIVILPQRTGPAQADRATTASDLFVDEPSTGQHPTDQQNRIGRHPELMPAHDVGADPEPSAAAARSADGVAPAGSVQHQSSGFGAGPQPTDWAQLEAGRPWQPESPWLEVTPLDVSEQGSRDPEQYAAVIDRFDVDGHRRYDYEHSNTYCNIFAWDVTKAMGVEIPHWYDENSGLETPLGEGIEMSANRMDAWFDAHGAEHGWRGISAAEAAIAAASGHPTLALWRNPNPSRSGHVALIRPESEPGELLIAQAGASNFSMGRYEDVFSNITPRFFTHD